ncbi:MAG: 50S ribosomal protein L29 [Patescibacteria group bacterium]
MEWADIKNKSEKELKEILAEQKQELHSLRFQVRSGQLKQVHKINQAKKTLARITMLLRQKIAVKK